MGIVALRVTPRSARPGIASCGGLDGQQVLCVRVGAPAAWGAANEAVRTLLARLLGISRSEVALVTGRTGRNTRVALPFAVSELRARLGDPQERTINHV